MMSRPELLGGKSGGGWVKRDKRWGREWARMWMKRVVQSLNFFSSSALLLSVVAAVVDLRLLINKSLSLGLGIGEPVSICCQNLFTKKEMEKQTNPNNLLIVTSRKNLGRYVQPADISFSSYFRGRETPTRKQSCLLRAARRFP